VQHQKIESSGLKPFFEKVVISEEVKAQKPKREIFEYAIKSANAKKNGSIMIGDDWEVDVMGALNFGIDAVHFINNSGIAFIQDDNSKLNRSIFKIGMFNQLQSFL